MSEGEAEITEVRAAHRFDEARLEAWLDGRLEGFRRPLTVRQFEGGHSNPTFLIASPDRRWVVRKKPPGDLLPSAHQVGREYTVLKALGGSGVPVPTVRLHCEDASVIGSEFFVMDWVKGRIFLDPSLPGMTPTERRAFFTDYLKVLARLHAIAPAEVGLSDYGRPGNYYERQISRWVRQYKAAQTDDHPDMERLMEWLPRTLPHQDRNTIVHGDYRLDNILFDRSRSALACAVVDWQTPGHGNGIADLAYFIGAGLLPAERRAHEWELVDRYVAGIERYGHKVDRDWVERHYRREAISGAVMAVVASQIVGRTERGDEMFVAMARRHARHALDVDALGALRP